MIIESTWRVLLMPTRKQNSHKAYKTNSSYIHPSLALRDKNSATTATAEQTSSATVNERIEHLRRTQGQRIPVPALLEELRSRASIPVVSRRRAAGPPPPASWLERRTFKYGTTSSNARPRRPNGPDYFPGQELPLQHTLIHHVLKSMAKNFDWHVQFDHSYLSVLPLELKEQFLSYVACYSPESSLTLDGLKMLFTNDATISASGNDDIHRLDLGGSVGYGLSIKELDRFLHAISWRANETEPLESWDLEVSLNSRSRFQSLRLLSLAYPGPSVKWTDLINLSNHLGALTHLSLAYWPTPGLLATASTTSSPQIWAKKTHIDFSDEAYILRQFSRATPSLQYLSLEGCTSWIRALIDIPQEEHTSVRRSHSRATDFGLLMPLQVEEHAKSNTIWTTSWRHLNTLVLGQGWLPRLVEPRFLHEVFRARGSGTSPSAISIIDGLPDAAPSTSLPPRSLQMPVLGSESPISSQSVTWSVALEHNHASLGHEAYTISASKTIADSVEAYMHRRQWCQNELELLQVDQLLTRWRKAAGQKPLNIDYCWDKHSLMDSGYDEADLFRAGF